MSSGGVRISGTLFREERDVTFLKQMTDKYGVNYYIFKCLDPSGFKFCNDLSNKYTWYKDGISFLKVKSKNVPQNQLFIRGISYNIKIDYIYYIFNEKRGYYPYIFEVGRPVFY